VTKFKNSCELAPLGFWGGAVSLKLHNFKKSIQKAVFLLVFFLLINN